MDPQLQLVLDEFKSVKSSMEDLKSSLSLHIKGVENNSLGHWHFHVGVCLMNDSFELVGETAPRMEL